MKVLFVGDVHNHMYIFEDVKKLDEQYKFDRIIFTGDYVDDWSTNNYDSLVTLDEVLHLKKSDPYRYTFCLGNHELSYLGFPCSGHRPEEEDTMYTTLKANIKCFDIFTKVILGDKEYICSHAGMSNFYLANIFPETDNFDETLELLNKDKLENLKLLTACSYLRGGKQEYSSCVWADRREHMFLNLEAKPVYPYQIIGHTPVEKIYIDDYTFIDTHSTYRNGDPFGDKSYLIWNEDKFEIKRNGEI